MSDTCDYCHATLNPEHYLRPTGFTELDGHRAPQVKTWCGTCHPDDEIDLEARAALLAAVQAGR